MEDQGYGLALAYRERQRDLLLMEIGDHFKSIAEWAIRAKEIEIIVVCEELAKLATHLETREIVQDAPKDAINGG